MLSGKKLRPEMEIAISLGSVVHVYHFQDGIEKSEVRKLLLTNGSKGKKDMMTRLWKWDKTTECWRYLKHIRGKGWQKE